MSDLKAWFPGDISRRDPPTAKFSGGETERGPCDPSIPSSKRAKFKDRLVDPPCTSSPRRGIFAKPTPDSKKYRRKKTSSEKESPQDHPRSEDRSKAMNIEIHPSAHATAAAAAQRIAELARMSVERHRTFSMALSGGTSPWAMLELLIAEDIPWSAIRVFQVDERKAPKGDAARNATSLEAILMRSPLPASHFHPMPVDDEDEARACADYARAIDDHCRKGRLDLVQLGLGQDGHSASWLPGSEAPKRAVAFTRAYLGYRRMTLGEAPRQPRPTTTVAHHRQAKKGDDGKAASGGPDHPRRTHRGQGFDSLCG
eukprot:XP_011407742.1 PREDICTED: uncharacterized protein LOC105314971 [Amphimedon queenslandica]